ncbi:MAG: Fic family protein [Flavobacteriales bacterium]|nr:Fic family protein [Flavobacteriales bacterium]
MRDMDNLFEAIADLNVHLNSLRPLSKEKENKILQKFRLDWNYHSNNLEGNSLTYGETKSLLLHGITAQGKPLKDHFEMTGHNECIDWVFEIVKNKEDISESFIKQMHTILLKERYQIHAQTEDGKPTKKWIEVGQYKSTPNHVKTSTGEIFYFATPEETPAKMHDLLEWYRSNEGKMNSVVLAIEFHYRFIRIHPFDDGNGRMARLLMNVILMRNRMPPVIIKTEDKENYFAALRQADGGNIEAFIKYIGENLIHSLDIMIAGASGDDIEESDDVLKRLKLLSKEIEEVSKSKKNVRKSSRLVTKMYTENITKLLNLLSERTKIVSEMFESELLQIKIGKLNSSKSQVGQQIATTLKNASEIIKKNVINKSEQLVRLEFELTYSLLKKMTFDESKVGVKFTILFMDSSCDIGIQDLKDFERLKLKYGVDYEFDFFEGFVKTVLKELTDQIEKIVKSHKG